MKARANFSYQTWPTAIPSRSPINPLYPLLSAHPKRTSANGKYAAVMVITPNRDNLTVELVRAQR